MSSKVAIKQILLVPVKYPTKTSGLDTMYGYSADGKDADIAYAESTEFKGPAGNMIKMGDAPDGLKFAVILDVADGQTRAGFKVYPGHKASEADMSDEYHEKTKGLHVWKDQAVSGAGLYVEDGAFAANMQQNKAYNSGSNKESWFRAARGQFANANGLSDGKYTVCATNASGITEFHHIQVSEMMPKAADLKGDKSAALTDGEYKSGLGNSNVSIIKSVVVQARKSTRSLESKIDALCSVNASLIELLKQKLL